MVISAPTRDSVFPLTQRLFNPRERIPPRTDVLWQIEHGAVRTLTRSEEGTPIILGYWGPGDVVGHALSRLLPYRIECLTRVKVSILPEALWCQAIEAIVSHTQQLEEIFRIVNHKSASLRLRQFLVWLSQKFGCDVDQGRLIDLVMTHEEIAETINTTRVTVTRTLRQLESEGVVLRHQRRIILC